MTSIKERLMQDLKEAMRAGDRVKVSVIRFLRNAINYEETSRGTTLDDAGVAEVVARQVRQRRESIEAFRKGGREDLARKEEAELQVLLQYLPEQLSREEIERMAREVIREVGAQTPRDMGKVMGVLMPRVRGRAEGRVVSEIVRELLASGEA